jgi:hypothetical protein
MLNVMNIVEGEVADAIASLGRVMHPILNNLAALYGDCVWHPRER